MCRRSCAAQEAARSPALIGPNEAWYSRLQSGAVRPASQASDCSRSVRKALRVAASSRSL